MAKVSLSRMNVEVLMGLRKRVDERLLECRAEIEKQLERMDLERMDREIALSWRQKGCSPRGTSKRVERQESPTEISQSLRRDMGRTRRKTTMACCCNEERKETRRFPDRQVGSEGT
jgi:hypothetical protein